MVTTFTKQILLAATLLGGTAVSMATPDMPEHFSKVKRAENTVKFKSAPGAITRSDEDCSVMIKLPEDLNGWRPDICVACAPHQPLVNPDGDYLYLKPGTYDIVARFIHSNMQSYTYMDYQGYVVLENVEVTGDMEVEVDPATITNHIEFKPLLPDGSALELPVINIDEDGNEIPVSDGSMPFNGLTIVDFIVGPGWGIDSSTTMSPNINAETPWGFYDPTLMFGIHINDVSERIHLGISTWVGTPAYKDAYTLILLAEQAGSKAGVISNDVSEYKFRDYNPAWTAAGASTTKLIEQFPSELEWINPYGYAIRRVAGDIITLSSGNMMTESKNQSIYAMAFSRNKVEDPEVHILVAPTKTELVKVDSNIIQTTNYGTWQQPFDDGEWLVYPQASMATTVESPSANFPFVGVEPFGFGLKDNDDTMFLTAPVITTTIERSFNPFEGNENLGFEIVSKGRMGEIRNTDLSIIEAEMKVKGVKVANSMEAIEEWWKGFDSEMAGETELKLIDSNFEADGLSASTVSTTHFDMSKTDFFPPTVTMLQIRNGEGKLSSCVAPESNNVILVSAGDFSSSEEQINYYGQTATFTTAPASFELWYAPTGTEDWKELDCTKLADEVTTGIGVIYSAEFSDAEKGWKDLKMRVEDASGNWQEQIIGMALCVSDTSGVNAVNLNKEVSVDGNNIVAPSGARIYTIDGESTDGKNLKAGVYVIRKGERTYRVFVK